MPFHNKPVLVKAFFKKIAIEYRFGDTESATVEHRARESCEGLENGLCVVVIV